jgi:hypothetical protein
MVMFRLRLLWLCVAALTTTISGSTMPRAGDAPLPADLAFVPADGIGFVHVRLGDIWKSNEFKEWRDTVLKAGETALAAFDKRFVPAPSSIDRVTVAILPTDNLQKEPDFLVILATTKPIDRAAFLEQMLSGGEKQQAGGKSFYVLAKQKVGMHFVDERTLAFGPVDAIRRTLSRPPARQGDLTAALRQTQQGKPLVAAVNVAALAGMLPPAALQQIPPPLQPLLKAKLATVSLDLEKNGQIDLRLIFADAQQAGDAEGAIKEGIKIGQMFLAKGREEMSRKVLGDGKPGTLEELPEAAGALFALGALNRLDEFLAAPPLRKEGSALALSVQMPPGMSPLLSLSAVQVALLVPAVQKVREAAARTQDQNNLKQMALAMHIYHDVHKSFPAAAICDNNGKPLLSWRVAILPYIEQDNLYKQFKLDEPWDSEHNRKLIPLMPPTYAIPGALPKAGETHYRVFVGGGALFDLDKQVKIPQITDGTSNTILITETTDSVTWTKPEDVNYDAQKPLPKLGGFFAGGFNIALADGSVRFVSHSIMEATLRAAITRAGGEVLGADW